MRKLIVYTLFVSVIMSQACKKKEEETQQPAADTVAVAKASVTKAPFGKLPDGQEVSVYTLKNKNGVELQVINYGAIVTSLKTPDKNGALEDIVLGFDSLQGYLTPAPYFGAIVGRYGNRIGKGKFKLDGKEYTLAQNNNGQHLHGGLVGRAVGDHGRYVAQVARGVQRQPPAHRRAPDRQAHRVHLGARV